MTASVSLSGIYNNLFKVEQWNVGVIRLPIADFLEADAKLEVSWLTTPQGGSLADPFGFVKDDRLFILCEEADLYGKGKITCYEERENHIFSKCQISLDLPVHASYPYLVESQGELFCVPETNQAREVAMYKASDFPRTWVKAATLIDDFKGVDSTIFRFNNKWWLACANEDDEPWRKLYLWHSNELMGPWTPHPSNPVKIDAASSRPAGTPFIIGETLYRPAQDCSEGYGRRVVINRVKKLTTEQFEEEEATILKPISPLYSDGFHTLSSVGDFTLIDGKRLRFVRSLREVKHNLARQKRNLQRRLDYS